MSSRLFVLLIPFVVIAIFWLMARYEGRLRHDPTHKGYFERNGMVLGIAFISLVALWALFLVVLPFLSVGTLTLVSSAPAGSLAAVA